MAESIITLGIGASPVSLTPFVTGGLFGTASSVLTAGDENMGFVVLKLRTQPVKRKERAKAVPVKDRVKTT